MFKIQHLLLLYNSARKKATTMDIIGGDRRYPSVRFEYKTFSDLSCWIWQSKLASVTGVVVLQAVGQAFVDWYFCLFSCLIFFVVYGWMNQKILFGANIASASLQLLLQVENE